VIAATSIEPAGAPPAGKTYALGSLSRSPAGRDRARTQSRVFAGRPCCRVLPVAVSGFPIMSFQLGSVATGPRPVPAGVTMYSTCTGSPAAFTVIGTLSPPFVIASAPE
jgi:hypothetical protein